jgi:hypothetical protein
MKPVGHGGHAVGPHLPDTGSGLVLLEASRKEWLQRSGAGSCMYCIRTLPVVPVPVVLADPVNRISLVLPCKAMFATHEGLPVTSPPCPHINLELLPVSTRSSLL